MPSKAKPVPPQKQIDPELRKQYLAAIWYSCSKIVEEEEVDLGVIASEAFVATLAELVYAQAESLAQDLEAFSKHAGRTSILADDMKLVCRKNADLHSRISQIATGLTGKAPSSKKEST